MLKEEKNINKLSHRHRVQRTPTVQDIRARETKFTNDAVVTGMIVLHSMRGGEQTRVKLFSYKFAIYLRITMLLVFRLPQSKTKFIVVPLPPQNRNPSKADFHL